MGYLELLPTIFTKPGVTIVTFGAAVLTNLSTNGLQTATPGHGNGYNSGGNGNNCIS
jgi:hypothetical protein